MARFKKFAVCIAAAALSTVVVATARAAQDPTEALAKAPAEVQATVKRSLGARKLEEFGKEKQGDKLVFEAGYKVDGVDHAVLVATDGSVVQEEADVEVSTLPAPVVEAIKKAHKKGKLDEAALAKSGDKSFYSIDVKIGGKTRVMNVAADGTVLSDVVETSAAEEK